MNPIWILAATRDGGGTWKLEQPYRLFKSHLRAEWTVHNLNLTHVRTQFKAVEFTPHQVINRDESSLIAKEET